MEAACGCPLSEGMNVCEYIGIFCYPHFSDDFFNQEVNSVRNLLPSHSFYIAAFQNSLK